MPDTGRQFAHTYDISTKVARLLQARAKRAQEQLLERVQKAYGEYVAELTERPMTPWDVWTDWYRYSVDFAQRSVLFWDTLRNRGSRSLAPERAAQAPALHFEHEIVLDARSFARPVNCALLRIHAPAGTTTDTKRRPYVIIDPRVGYGPDVSDFKDDAQVALALHAGHPVYFVVFFPAPEPGQTLLDITAAQRRFVHKVRELHRESPKPVVVGNCQGGWAAMMLAAADADEIGPIVINGAPMSYESGAAPEGTGVSPMRYMGALAPGSWLASFTADLGKDIFDGAYLMQGFENLNPANAFWDKYYHFFAHIDTEAPRFLELERWWGGFYLLDNEEMQWITQTLFVGDPLRSSTAKPAAGEAFDLKRIRAPIILFASMGDDVTPAQQVFDWVAAIYGSTAEIKARGQVIVGLLQRSSGHLGFFVSGSVARKGHAQAGSVLEAIERLSPGLYGMAISETTDPGGEPTYTVELREHSLEEVIARGKRFLRGEEKPFQAVDALTDFNQRAYELFARPLVQAMSNELSQLVQHELNPLPARQASWSDLNPWLAWLGPTAQMVRAQRQELATASPTRRTERMMAEIVSASLDFYRAMRDAISEAVFFQAYGHLFSLTMTERDADARIEPRAAEALPRVQEALAAIDQGGYPEALARVAALLDEDHRTIPLARLELNAELRDEYGDLLPDLGHDELRRIAEAQDLIVRHARSKAIETLPRLLADRQDRERLLELVRKLSTDARLLGRAPNKHDVAVVAMVMKKLAASAGTATARVEAKKTGKTRQV